MGVKGPGSRMGSRKRSRRAVASVSFSDSPPKAFGRVLMEDRIPSRLSLKNELIGKVLATLKKNGLAKEQQEQARWRLCLDEALVNAIVHGNNGDPRRFVSLKLMSGRSRWAVLVEDEGEGFSERELPDAGSAHSLYSESGRGVLLMRQYADAVRYYRGGSALLLVKSRQQNEKEKRGAKRDTERKAKSKAPKGKRKGKAKGKTKGKAKGKRSGT